MGNFDDYSKAEFGDKRLGDRLATILEQLSGEPTASISAACRDPYQAKAVYRFLANDNTKVEEITKISRDATIRNINDAKPPVLLIAEDTTELNYTNLKAAEGLGNIGTRKTDMGILVHSAIGVDEMGMVYGVLAQKIWIRPPEEHGKSDKRGSVPYEEKESFKWAETMKSAEVPQLENTLVVHVCDREGDIYEFFCKAEDEGSKYLCRRRHNRKISTEDSCEWLDTYMGALPEAGRIAVSVPRDSHSGRVARQAVLEIKYGKCSIEKPVNLPASSGVPKNIEVYVVSAVEIDPPEGQEKIFWQLITNVPTASFEDAVTRILWYTQRWKIETFHRTLKSGCKVEELQAGSAEKLMKLIAIYSVIALEILFVTYIARTRPDESCEICLAEEEWQILYKVANKTKTLPDKPPTIREAVVMIAKLGGFLGRKSDGNPGATVIWRGLTKLYTILDAIPFFA